MQLSTAVRDRLMAQLTAPLAGGELVFLDGSIRSSSATPLVIVPLRDGFVAGRPGEAIAASVPVVTVRASGQIGWAQLVDSRGELVATLTVDDQPGADIRVKRLDVSRDGEFEVGTFILTLPAGA